MSFYGPAGRMGDLGKVARTFRVLNIDADPGGPVRLEAVAGAQLMPGGRPL